MAHSPDDIDNLGTAIRADAPRFTALATAAFRDLFAREYYRLRGYAHERAGGEITLKMTIRCRFEGENRGVVLTTCPDFAPAAKEVVAPLPDDT